MTTKKKLQAFFDERHDDAQYISVYEENIEFFNDLLRTGRAEELDYVLPIKLLKYADPLGQSGQYSKALRVLTEVEADLPKLRGRSEWYAMYEESLTFLKAVNLARSKRFKESNILFKKLLQGKQENERYADWYRSNLKSMVTRYTNVTAVVGGGALIFLFIGRWIFPGFKGVGVETLALFVVLLSLVGPMLFSYWVDRRPVRPVAKHK
jgi:tetratricopeptide (TPR) repeat protein